MQRGLSLMDYRVAPSQNSHDISALFTHVFSDSEGPNEGLLIGELVTNIFAECDSDEFIPFIAIYNNTLFGAVVFSKLSSGSNPQLNSYILSPMAVATSQQGKGIGSKLITFALTHLKTLGVDFVVTYGDPNYYAKLGFAPLSDAQLVPPCKLSYPHGWQALSLSNREIDQLEGTVSCVKPLNNPEYW